MPDTTFALTSFFSCRFDVQVQRPSAAPIERPRWFGPRRLALRGGQVWGASMGGAALLGKYGDAALLLRTRCEVLVG